MMAQFWVFLLVLVPILSVAQKPTVKTVVAERSLQLGMDRANVHGLLGIPRRWSRRGRYFESLAEFNAAMKVYEPELIADVYTRRTRSNLYELSIRYEADYSSPDSTRRGAFT
jgi:hypothetical protein